MTKSLRMENRVNLITKRYLKVQIAQKRINSTTTAQIHAFQSKSTKYEVYLKKKKF